MRNFHIVFVVLVSSVVMAACGGGDQADGSTKTASQRVAACLEQQPDATKAQCSEWEADGTLADDGTHKNHDSMKMD